MHNYHFLKRKKKRAQTSASRSWEVRTENPTNATKVHTLNVKLFALGWLYRTSHELFFFDFRKSLSGLFS